MPGFKTHTLETLTALQQEKKRAREARRKRKQIDAINSLYFSFGYKYFEAM